MGAGHSRRTRRTPDLVAATADPSASATQGAARQGSGSQYPYPGPHASYYNQPHPQGAYYGGQRPYIPNNGHFYGGGGNWGPPPGGYMPPYQNQQSMRQAPPESQTQKTSTIRNDVNLKKPTLKVSESEEKPGTLLVSFSYDAAAPGSLSVFFNVAEDTQQGCKLNPKNGPAVLRRFKFDKGLGQEFKQSEEDGLDLSAVEQADLLSTGPATFPLVVRLETIRTDAGEDGELELPEPPGGPLEKWVQSQTTYATLTKNAEGHYAVRVLKQKIWVDGVSYELQEIYGIEQSTSSSTTSVTNSADDSGKECVICLAEPRDTTVLPCRHMCMCSTCARLLRHQTNRCPICRTQVEGLLEIKVERRS